MAGVWIDFAELREKINFAAVLKHYGVQLKIRKGDQHQGFCPLPNHQGKRKSPSFSANLTRKCFHCFGCGARGNCIDFCCVMQNMDPDQPADIRKAALYLQEHFLGGVSQPNRTPPAAPNATGRTAVRDASAEPDKALPVIINAPLDFELKGLDPNHPYLKGRGFNTETIVHFGLGFCSKGIMTDRIAIPLHDQHGRLIGYAGRLVDDNSIDEENPKYRLPGSRERAGKIYQFEKSRFLYNGFPIGGPVCDLIVVEGFPSTWWLWQNGFPNVVALMGADCSEDQARLITELVTKDGTVSLLTDGDEAGERCVKSIVPEIAQHRRVRWAKLALGKQPTDLRKDELAKILA